jgi:hypothetical protein
LLANIRKHSTRLLQMPTKNNLARAYYIRE